VHAGHVGYRGRPDDYRSAAGVSLVQRWRRGDDGLWTKVDFPSPPAVSFYAANMRGVDMSDAVRDKRDCRCRQLDAVTDACCDGS
jgi:hypothetical protein